MTRGTSLEEIKGQENAKRALLIAVAGGHNILMTGSPGGGKTMLAQATISLLPELSFNQLIEVTQIYSATGLLNAGHFINRPFRSPHHNASLAAVIGGGTNPKPGEISLAHHGVLFLDELPEFRRDVLEALRQPLESRTVTVSRSKSNLTFPANFMLVAAMNPCPCGYYNDEQKDCSCSAHEVIRYRKIVSVPLLNRIDIQIQVPRVELKELRQNNKKEESSFAKTEVDRTRKIQLIRQKKLNAEMSSKECEQFIKLDKEAEALIEKLFKKSLVTARGYYKVLKIAQTIADLEKSAIVRADYLEEAFNYLLKD